MFYAYCEVGLELAKFTGHFDAFDMALDELKAAEERIGDSAIGKAISRFMWKASNIGTEPIDSIEIELDDE